MVRVSFERIGLPDNLNADPMTSQFGILGVLVMEDFGSGRIIAGLCKIVGLFGILTSVFLAAFFFGELGLLTTILTCAPLLVGAALLVLFSEIARATMASAEAGQRSLDEIQGMRRDARAGTK